MIETTINEDTGWRAICSRDASFDGTFYYGVCSTKIFCRPSCASRQPKRENVQLFALPEAARLAGFRACLRCRPETTATVNPQAVLIQKVCRALETAEESFSLATLAAGFDTSESHLGRIFKQLVGVTPGEYAQTARLKRFKTNIRNGATVTDAMYDAGYASPSRLYETANSELGMTPATYRKGGDNVPIVFTVAACSLGRLLVAATPKGICAVALGDSDEDLIANLKAEFPRADIDADDADLQLAVEKILKHLNGREPHLDLPLDVRATAFQRRVWDELRRIPPGETRSYREIAANIGQPTAARAVARACATNPTALITPCHRVVRENGDLSGYRWGIERKRKLLTQEKKGKLQQ